MDTSRGLDPGRYDTVPDTGWIKVDMDTSRGLDPGRYDTSHGLDQGTVCRNDTSHGLDP
jgi:hypothetical protein